MTELLQGTYYIVRGTPNTISTARPLTSRIVGPLGASSLWERPSPAHGQRALLRTREQAF